MLCIRTFSLPLAGVACFLAGCGGEPRHAPAPVRPAHQICLNAGNIDHLSYPDDKTILFHMKGGKVKIWKNTLQHACPNMKFQGGIAYEIRGGTICANMQTFYVISYWNPCMMGDFTPYTALDMPYTPPETKGKK